MEFTDLIPTRSVEDIIGGRVPVVLGRARYVLPELPMDATDEWSGAIDERLRGLLEAIDELAEAAGLLNIYEMASRFQAELLDTLIAYDRDKVLPDKAAIRSTATHTEVMFSVLGVWSATSSPLAATVVTILKQVSMGDDKKTPAGSEPRPISQRPKRSTSRRPKSVPA
jgi:hypothetical protein